MTNTPGQNLVSTNFVYIGEKVFGNVPTYLKINNCVFLAQGHNKVADDQVALNKLQRTSARVSPDRPIIAEVFVPPKLNFHLASLSLEADFINPEAVVNPEVDAKLLTEHVQTLYGNHIFAENQRFVIAFEGEMITAKGIYFFKVVTKSGWIGCA